MHPSIYGFGRVGEMATSDPTTNRLLGAAMTVTLANFLHIVVPKRYGTVPKKKFEHHIKQYSSKTIEGGCHERKCEEENTSLKNSNP